MSAEQMLGRIIGFDADRGGAGKVAVLVEVSEEHRIGKADVVVLDRRDYDQIRSWAPGIEVFVGLLSRPDGVFLGPEVDGERVYFAKVADVPDGWLVRDNADLDWVPLDGGDSPGSIVQCRPSPTGSPA